MKTELLSASEAASRMGKSLREVQRLCKEGLLPHQVVGGRYLITSNAAEAYVAARRGRPEKHAA